MRPVGETGAGKWGRSLFPQEVRAPVKATRGKKAPSPFPLGGCSLSGKLVLIVGGARSGKSRFAQRLAQSAPQPVGYVATALACDAEMRERIARHRADRPSEWLTHEFPEGALEDPSIESPLGALIRSAAGTCATLIADCLTIYLARRLAPFYHDDLIPRGDQEAAEALVRADLAAMVAAQRESGASLIIVSNELGWGVVPPYASGRLLRDISGTANQTISAQADHAYFVMAGAPLDLHALQAAGSPYGEAPRA